MLSSVVVLLLSTAPLPLSLEVRSEALDLPAERIEQLLTQAFLTGGEAKLDPQEKSLRVGANFTGRGTGFQLRFLLVRQDGRESSLVFQFQTTRLGDAGAAKMAMAVVSAGRKLLAEPHDVPVAEETPAPAKPPVDPAATHTVFAELAGSGLAYSVNYEHRFLDMFGVRAGLSYFGVGVGDSAFRALWVPVGLSYLGVRSGKHGLDAGLGVTIYAPFVSVAGAGSAAAVFPMGWVNVGYRYHPLEGHPGFNFRVGAMAFVGAAVTTSGLGFNLSPGTLTPLSTVLLPWGYVSFGASF